MWRLARVAACLVVGVLALAPATAREAPSVKSRQAKEPSRLLGLVSREIHGGVSLVSVDPRSLQPSGRSLSLFGAGAWAYSPGRSRLALAGPCLIGNGLSGGIVFVDVAHVRAAGCLWIGGVTVMMWPEPRRLLAVTSEVVSIDPVRRRVLARSPLPQGQVVGVARGRDALVLLLASGGYGRIVVVDEHGTVETAALELPAGVQPREGTFVRPALVVDPAGERAFVVPAAGPVAEVSLEPLAVAYHELREPASFLQRLAAWLEPAAHAKTLLPGTSREAAWVGDGKLAVTGIGSPTDPERSAGLALVDTRTWSIGRLDAGVDSVVVAQGRIVATGARAGLAVFDPDGRLLYRRFEGKSCWIELIHRGRIYVGAWSERRLRVLELATGKPLGSRAAPLPRLLLAGSG